MFAFTAVGALGGVALPALQGIMSNQVPANEQGELRGALTSLMSLTSVIGPLMMSYLFAYFTSPQAPFQLASAPYWVAALLTIFAVIWIKRVLEKTT
jgi:DHA1 family tetracycline resistance protein-like MFS transporter